MDVLEQRPAAVDATAAPPTEGQKKRVLLVEDQGVTRVLLLCLLSKAGLHVDFASNVEAGLKKLHSHTPDALLMEVPRRGSQEPDLIQAARRHPEFANRPIYVYTGRLAEGSRAWRALATRGTKPFSKFTTPLEVIVSRVVAELTGAHIPIPASHSHPANRAQSNRSAVGQGAQTNIAAGMRASADLLAGQSAAPARNGAALDPAQTDTLEAMPEYAPAEILGQVPQEAELEAAATSLSAPSAGETADLPVSSTEFATEPNAELAPAPSTENPDQDNVLAESPHSNLAPEFAVTLQPQSSSNAMNTPLEIQNADRPVSSVAASPQGTYAPMAAFSANPGESEQTLDPVAIIIDQTGQILAAEPVCTAQFQQEPTELVSHTLEALLKVGADQVRQRLAPGQDQHRPGPQSSLPLFGLAQRKDGSTFPVAISLTEQTVGDVSCWAVAFHDMNRPTAAQPEMPASQSPAPTASAPAFRAQVATPFACEDIPDMFQRAITPAAPQPEAAEAAAAEPAVVEAHSDSTQPQLAPAGSPAEPQIEPAQPASEALAARCAELEAQLAQATQAAERLGHELSTEQDVRALSEQALRELEQRLAQNTEELNHAQAELKQQVDQLAAAKGVAEQAEAALKEKVTLCTQLEEQLAQTHQAGEQSNQQLAAEQQARTQANDRLHELEQRLAQSAEELTRAQANLQDQTAERERWQRESSSQIAAAQAATRQAEAALNEKTARCTQLEEELAQSRQTGEQLQQELSTEQQARAKAEERLGKLEQRLAQSAEELNRAQAELQHQAVERERLECENSGRITAAQAATQQTEAALAEKTARCAQLEEELARNGQAAAQLDQQLSAEQQALTQANSRLQELEQRLAQSAEDLKRTQTDFDHQAAQLSAAQAAAQQAEAALKDTTARCAQLEAQLAQSRQADHQLNDQLSTGQQALAEANTRVQELEQRLAWNTEELERVQAQNQKLAALSQVPSESETALQVQLLELETRVRAGVAALARVTADLETERGERRRTEQRATDLAAQLQGLHEELKTHLESERLNHQRVTELEQQLRQREEKLAQTSAALQKESADRQSAEDHLRTVADLQARLETNPGLVEDARFAFQRAQQDLEQQLENRLKRVAETEARLQQEAAERQRQIQALEERERQHREKAQQHELTAAKLQSALQLEQCERKRLEADLLRSRYQASDSARTGRALVSSLRRQMQPPVENLHQCARRLLQLSLPDDQKGLVQSMLQNALLLQTSLQETSDNASASANATASQPQEKV